MVNQSTNDTQVSSPEANEANAMTSPNTSIPGLSMLDSKGVYRADILTTWSHLAIATESSNEPTSPPKMSEISNPALIVAQSEPSNEDTAPNTEDDKSVVQEDTTPSVTQALETMLGGITPPAETPQVPEADKDTLDTTEQVTAQNIASSDVSMEGAEQLTAGQTSTTVVMSEIPESVMLDVNTDIRDTQEAEFEIDSSPIEDSSDDSSDSSDDSSSSEDSEAGESYKLLSVEEQARILMEGDGGSDDEGGASKGKGAGSQLRTKNEVPEEVIPKPDVTITPEMKIEELGTVEAIVESILLIKAKTSGEYRVLESGSVLCLADRSVIGVVSETLGRVQQPLYSVRFTNAGEITEAGLSIGTKVFYSEQHSTYVFTQALKAFKGSDASNLHDEEVGDEEIEFSDDEAEAEHKKSIKEKKKERRGGKMQQNGGRNDHPLKQEHKPYDSSMGLSYDDAEDEGPYKPLSRPTGYGNAAGRGEAPEEGVGYAGRSGRDGNSSSRDSRGRGRGDRGRGRGDRGRGRGGYQDRRGDGFSQPPRDQRNNGYTQPQYTPNNSGFGVPPPNPYSQQQPQYPSPYAQPSYNPQQQHYATAQQQYQYPYPQPPPNWSSSAPQPPVPNGAYINPVFFPQQHQQATGPPQGPPQPDNGTGLQALLRYLQPPNGSGGNGHGI